MPPLEKIPIGARVLVVPPPVRDEEIRSDFLNFAQAMPSNVNTITSHVQDIMAQVKQEVGPHNPQHASTMSSHLRDFTRLNPHMFFGSKEGEDPKTFFMRSTRSFFLWV